MKDIKKFVKQNPFIINNRLVKKIRFGCSLARKMAKKPLNKSGQLEFTAKHFTRLYVQPFCDSKSEQIAKLLHKVDIMPVESKYFLYSVDYYKTLQSHRPVFGNTTVNYLDLVNGNFRELREKLTQKNSDFSIQLQIVLDAMQDWTKKVQKK